MVEVLVASVIVAILLAVAAPLYSGYVRKQRIDNIQNLAQTAAVAANAYYRRHDAVPDSARLGLFLPNPAQYQIQVEDPNVTVRDASDPDNIYSTVRYR